MRLDGALSERQQYTSREQRRQSQRRGLSPVSELWQGPPPNALVVDSKVVIGTALQHTAVAGYKPALPGNGHNALVVDLKVVTGTAPQRTAVAGYKPALPGNGHDALVVDLNVVTGTARNTRRSQVTDLRYRGMGPTLL